LGERVLNLAGENAAGSESPRRLNGLRDDSEIPQPHVNRSTTVGIYCFSLTCVEAQ